jgi:hypothetical protein
VGAERIDLAGRRFGRLIARRVVVRAPRVQWLCSCDCGRTVRVRNNNLLSGNTRSCGCAHVRHGQAKFGHRSTEYHAWINMKSRVRRDRNYRGRVSICRRWSVFENFFADMGRRPSVRHSIERVNNDGNYTPKNCLWATRVEQQNNRRVCKYITAEGLRLTIAQWARRLGTRGATIQKRLLLGWGSVAAVTVPVGGQR